MHALKRNHPLRRITLASAATVSAVVLLLSLKPHSAEDVSITSSSSSVSSVVGTRTVKGDSVDTQWGPVQVEVTVKDGKITDIEAVEYPANNPHDISINNYALPILKEEVLKAQSADIDTVSGATVTCDGYRESLQSALDSLGS